MQAGAADTTIFSDTSLSEANQAFLRRMIVLVRELEAWTLRDEDTKMSKIDYLKADLLYLCDLQNLICEYFQHFVAILHRPAVEDKECQLIN